ncbi:DUF6893 family small protein [Kitasatospora sp. NPDC048365]
MSKLFGVAVVTTVAVLVWQNLDDIRRYLRISRM